MWHVVLALVSGGVVGYVVARLPIKRWRRVAPVLPRKRRLTLEQMDAIKARMLREGYPLSDGTAQGNETIWRSLTRRVRRPQLQALLGWTDAQIDARVRELRKQRRDLTGRR